MKKYSEKLKKITKDYDRTDLEKNVAKMILDELADGYDAKGFFSDLFNYGCISGMVSGLVYYKDTHEFAKANIEDILRLKSELEEEIGKPVMDREGGDELNFLAWFGFEETARNLAHEIGIDV